MNYKDIMIDSQKNGVTAYTKFVLEYSKYENVVACFVEGTDSCYYSSKVKNEIKEKYEDLFYPCNGKKEVERVQNMISQSLHLKDSVKTLFFADSDYDLDDKNSNIYYTDYYSVENFYCQRETIESILTRYFAINKYSEDYNICMSIFDNDYNKYLNEIKKVNAYAYSIRVNEKKNSIQRFDLSSVKTNTLYEKLELDSFQIEELDYNKIKGMFKNSVEITEEEYKQNISNINVKKLRGKWEISFFSWFLEKLRTSVREGRYGLEMNKKVKTSFNRLMDVATEDSIMTNGLKEYIRTSCTV